MLCFAFQASIDATLTMQQQQTQVQRNHQQRISDERYACIYRNLAKFDKQKQLPISEYSNSLIRAAIYRARFKLNKNKQKDSMRLLCITAVKAFNLSSLSAPILFHGLIKSNKYRENLLNGLWSYQSRNLKSEQAFNQWLSNRICNCAICYLFNANKYDNESSVSTQHLFMLDEINNKIIMSNDMLKCSHCYVSVHRECYENLCLALNVKIHDKYVPWYCQRCSLENEVIKIEIQRIFCRHKSSSSFSFSRLPKYLIVIVLLVYFAVVFFSILIHHHPLLTLYARYFKLMNSLHYPHLHKSNHVIIVGHFVH